MHKLAAELQHWGLLLRQPRPGHGRILDAHLTDQGQQLLTDADTRAQAIDVRLS